MIVFAGGARLDALDAVMEDGYSMSNAPPPSITIMRGKRLAVMHMDHAWIDFVALCSSPYFNGELFRYFYRGISLAYN